MPISHATVEKFNAVLTRNNLAPRDVGWVEAYITQERATIAARVVANGEQNCSSSSNPDERSPARDCSVLSR